MKRKAHVLAGLAAVLAVLLICTVCSCTRKGGFEGFDPYEVYSEDVGEYKPLYEGPNAKTVYAARDLTNGVNVFYPSPDRSKVRIINRDAVIDYRLAAGAKQMTSLSSVSGAEGGVYLENTADAFIELTDGTLYTSADSDSTPNLNIYRHGSYYYEAHILGQDFARFSEIKEKTGFELRMPDETNAVTDVKFKNGSLTFETGGADDPYICWNGLDVDADKFASVSITMKNKKSISGEIYVVAGSFGGFNADQHRSFTIVPDGESNTYTVSLAGIVGYKGTLRGLRLDIGTGDIDTVTIEKIEFLARDETHPPVQLDKTFHTYTDKLNCVDRFAAAKKAENIAAVGSFTRIDKSKVEKVVVKDASGLKNSFDGVDWETAEYAGFDIKGAGIFGYILLPHETSGTLSVYEEDGYYVIRQAFSPYKGIIKKGTVVEVGRRYYTDTAHDFDGFLREAEFERHPLENVKNTSPSSDGEYIGYNAIRGCYEFSIGGAPSFMQPYYEYPDKHFAVSVSLSGAEEDRTVYVYTHTGYTGGLECAVVLDENNLVLPVKTQVSKNFSGDGDDTLFFSGDPSYSDTFFPVVVEAGRETKLTVLNLYQNWGKFPLKQLSSIHFFTTYYHLSTGVTETNCIAPFFVYGKDYWLIPDFRPMSAPLWASQPQHTSGGCPRVIQYTSSDKGFAGLELATKYIDSSGPVYSDLLLNYISDDGRLAASYRHVEMPQTDESRAYYDVDIKVLEDIPFENFARDFSFYGMDGRFVFYDTLGYLDKNNAPAYAETNRSLERKYYVLGKNCPYVDIHGCDSNDYVNMAVLVADSDITVGGKKFTGNFVVSDYASWDLNRVNLSLNLGKVTLRAGDRMKLRLIVMPYGSQELEGDERVRLVRENTCLSPVRAESASCSVIEGSPVPKVRSADGKTAEFTISGGAANIPALNERYYRTCDHNIAVRVYGFDSFAAPEIYEKVDGEWVRYEVASANGYDGYAVYCDKDNSFSYAFVVTMNEAKPRTFKVVTP